MGEWASGSEWESWLFQLDQVDLGTEFALNTELQNSPR